MIFLVWLLAAVGFVVLIELAQLAVIVWGVVSGRLTGPVGPIGEAGERGEPGYPGCGCVELNNFWS